jgi:ubiquinone/menaquinone biosynthesis C-methylase UbiE
MKDRFSGYAAQYATFRPHYPKALFDFIFQHVKSFDLAWDAGTGNGQAAAVLATRFRKVYATDISQKQLDNAVLVSNVEYAAEGETVRLPDRSVDLITVAQAIHWFDREKFYIEVSRVSRKGAIISAWGYGLLSISEAIDPLIVRFYKDVVGPYWDSERRLIDEHYRTIEFPFKEIQNPGFQLTTKWTLDQLEGYISTWSSVQQFIRKNGYSPVPEWIEKVKTHWSHNFLRVTFRVFARVGVVE